MQKTIVIASGNKDKIKEIQTLLKGYKIIPYKDILGDIEIIETGTTFFENAYIKAKTVSEKANMPALADDSGISVETLNGAPGIYSARYSGLGDEGNNDKLLKELEFKENRKAKYCCSMVLCMPDGEYIDGYGECEGEILKERVGTNGFGYDSIFYSYELQKPMGLVELTEKNAVSHRQKALKQLVDKITK